MKLVDIFTAMCVGTMLLSIIWLIGLFTYMIYQDSKSDNEKYNHFEPEPNVKELIEDKHVADIDLPYDVHDTKEDVGPEADRYWEKYKSIHHGDELIGIPHVKNNHMHVIYMTVDQYDKYRKEHK